MERPRHRRAHPWTAGEEAAYYRNFISTHRAAAEGIRSTDSEWAEELAGMADDRQYTLDRLVDKHGDALDGVTVEAGRFVYAEGYSDELGEGWS